MLSQTQLAALKAAQAKVSALKTTSSLATIKAAQLALNAAVAPLVADVGLYPSDGLFPPTTLAS